MYSDKDVETWEGSQGTLTKSVQSLSDPEDCSVKGPHKWMLTDWLGTGSQLSWAADCLYQHRRFEEIPFHMTLSLMSPVLRCLIANESLIINFFNGKHGHYFYHFVEFFIFFLCIPVTSVLPYAAKRIHWFFIQF